MAVLFCRFAVMMKYTAASLILNVVTSSTYTSLSLKQCAVGGNSTNLLTTSPVVAPGEEGMAS